MLVQDIVLSASTLQRIRALSRPMAILLTIALVMIVVFPALEIGALLLLFHRGDAWQALASFSGTGFNLSAFEAAHPLQQLGAVAIADLDGTQRLEIAALAAVCAACQALAILNLRQLFSLYSRGEVFAPDSVGRLKRFALWLALGAFAANISGRLFAALTGAGPVVLANALMTVLCGVMIYVIAHVLQLACEADGERREFV